MGQDGVTAAPSRQPEARSERGRPVTWRAAGWLFLGAVTVGLAFAVPALPWRQAVAHLAPAWLPVAIAVYLLEFPLWAAEWRLIVPTAQPVGWSRMIEITALSSAAQNTLPLFGGQVSALVLLVMRGGVTRGAALSVLAIDQLVTGVVKLILLGLAVLVAPVPPWMREGTAVLLGLVVAFLAAMLAAAHGSRGLRRLAPWLPARAVPVALAFAEWTLHLEPMRSVSRGSRVLALAAAKKAIEIVGALVAQRACGIPFDPAQAVMIVAALGLSTVLPRIPANLGIYEATVLLVYEWCGVPTDAALAAALFQHVAFLLPAVGSGYLILVTRQLRARPSPS